MEAEVKLTRGPVRIVGVWGERQREGWIYEDALGLVRMPLFSGHGWIWSVTHIPTGLAAASHKTKTEAMAALQALLKIAPAETWLRVSVVDGKVTGLTRQQQKRCRRIAGMSTS